jgi:hypothetical protein
MCVCALFSSRCPPLALIGPGNFLFVRRSKANRPVSFPLSEHLSLSLSRSTKGPDTPWSLRRRAKISQFDELRVVTFQPICWPTFLFTMCAALNLIAYKRIEWCGLRYANINTACKYACEMEQQTVDSFPMGVRVKCMHILNRVSTNWKLRSLQRAIL